MRVHVHRAGQPSESRFNRRGGLRPRSLARRYVYGVMTAMLRNELLQDGDLEGWMFVGIDNERDRRQLAKAIVTVIAEMNRKASGRR